METLFWAVVLSLPILPNLWCIWHASRHDFPMPNERKLWVRAGTFAPIIGGILYLAVGMRRARPPRKPGDAPPPENPEQPGHEDETGPDGANP